MAQDAGNGITRYTAGFFKTFNVANQAKTKIRSIGYSDAFVVAFYNGKRINITKAKAMLDGTATAPKENTDFLPMNNNINDNTTTNTNDNTVDVNETEEVKDGISTDVRNIDGIFYTIQVGVYSKPVTPDQLTNLTPLNSERTSTGLIRYTSGNYKTISRANLAKTRIRLRGLSDAFIIAYRDGKRISVKKANELIYSGDDGTTTTDESNNITTETIKKDLKIEFKVKLGEYSDDVPIEDAGIFLQLTGRGVKTFEKDNKTVYTIGSFSDYNEALDVQIEMKDIGVKQPSIIAFQDGTAIDIDKALELIKNNQ